MEIVLLFIGLFPIPRNKLYSKIKSIFKNDIRDISFCLSNHITAIIFMWYQFVLNYVMSHMASIEKLPASTHYKK